MSVPPVHLRGEAVQRPLMELDKQELVRRLTNAEVSRDAWHQRHDKLRALFDKAQEERPAVFVDLDSTLADTRQRWHLINAEDRDATDWVAYSMACADDVPIAGMVALVRLLYSLGVRINILSARSEPARKLTEEWLSKHSIPYTRLLLRGDPNEGSVEFKLRCLADFVADHPDTPVPVVIDDLIMVRDAVEAAGLPVLLVNPAYHETAETQFGVGAV